MRLKDKFPTTLEFIGENNFNVLTKMYSDVDQKTLIKMNTVQLRDLSSIYGYTTPSLFIEAILGYLNVYLNVKDENKLNDNHIREIGRQLSSRFKVLTIGEVWLFFERVMKGEFGIFYNSIDPIQLNKWSTEFMERRGKIILEDEKLMIYIRDREWEAL